MNLKGYYVDCSDYSFEYPYIFFIPTGVWIKAHDAEEPPTPIPGVKNHDYAMSHMASRPVVARSALAKLKGKSVGLEEFEDIGKRIAAATEERYSISHGFIAVGYKEQDMAVLFRLMLD